MTARTYRFAPMAAQEMYSGFSFGAIAGS